MSQASENEKRHDITDRIYHDRYQIQQRLGKKSGRQTLLALDLTTQQPVILKLLTFNPDFEWTDLKLFEREAEVLQSLDHPAIPKYLDHFEFETESTQGFALVQSYIDAPSLEQHLKAGRVFSEEDLKQIARSLLKVLTYLHQQNPPVIHRDIKPSNILLGDRSGNHPGQIYLIDFGSVQTLLAQEGGTITVVGTYGYMPPEQFGGRAVPASDLYSLGATLIYLATGNHPADLPQKNLRIIFQKFTNLSEEFTHWLRWIIDPSIEKRPTSAKEALQCLGTDSLRQTNILSTHSIGYKLTKLRPESITFHAIQKSLIAACLAGVIVYGGVFILHFLISDAYNAASNESISLLRDAWEKTKDPRISDFLDEQWEDDWGKSFPFYFYFFYLVFFWHVPLIVSPMVGLAHGILTSKVTLKYFYPLKSRAKYRQFMRNTAFKLQAVAVSVIVLFFILTSFEPTVSITMADLPEALEVTLHDIFVMFYFVSGYVLPIASLTMALTGFRALSFVGWYEDQNQNASSDSDT